MSYLAILGRQPEISIAELERVFGSNSVSLLSDEVAKIECNDFDIQSLGGTPKAGKIVLELEKSDWKKVSKKIVQHYSETWSNFEGKITLGISTYGFNINTKEVQKNGIILKQKLKKSGVSLRLVPNTESALNTAVSHHNKLGLSPNKVEILIVHANDGSIVIAESTGSQNITAYTKRDQNRPKRDVFVGMLPPKLAQIMINLACDQIADTKPNLPSTIYHLPSTILDPFCGTGVILQEAALMGYSVYGTDLSEKMVRYSRDNLNWLADSHHAHFDWYLHEGDAMTTKWQQPIDIVVSEVYLGQPFSAPPSSAKLEEVKQNCNHIVTEFLKNIASQIKPGTPVCLAISAWIDEKENITHLPIVNKVTQLGFKSIKLNNLPKNNLIYHRKGQIVAREILILTRV